MCYHSPIDMLSLMCAPMHPTTLLGTFLPDRRNALGAIKRLGTQINQGGCSSRDVGRVWLESDSESTNLRYLFPS
jgi:hypothetical protein